MKNILQGIININLRMIINHLIISPLTKNIEIGVSSKTKKIEIHNDLDYHLIFSQFSLEQKKELLNKLGKYCEQINITGKYYSKYEIIKLFKEQLKQDIQNFENLFNDGGDKDNTNKEKPFVLDKMSLVDDLQKIVNSISIHYLPILALIQDTFKRYWGDSNLAQLSDIFFEITYINRNIEEIGFGTQLENHEEQDDDRTILDDFKKGILGKEAPTISQAEEEKIIQKKKRKKEKTNDDEIDDIAIGNSNNMELEIECLELTEESLEKEDISEGIEGESTSAPKYSMASPSPAPMAIPESEPGAGFSGSEINEVYAPKNERSSLINRFLGNINLILIGIITIASVILFGIYTNYHRSVLPHSSINNPIKEHTNTFVSLDNYKIFYENMNKNTEETIKKLDNKIFVFDKYSLNYKIVKTDNDNKFYSIKYSITDLPDIITDNQKYIKIKKIEENKNDLLILFSAGDKYFLLQNNILLYSFKDFSKFKSRTLHDISQDTSLLFKKYLLTFLFKLNADIFNKKILYIDEPISTFAKVTMITSIFIMLSAMLLIFKNSFSNFLYKITKKIGGVVNNLINQKLKYKIYMNEYSFIGTLLLIVLIVIFSKLSLMFIIIGGLISYYLLFILPLLEIKKFMIALNNLANSIWDPDINNELKKIEDQKNDEISKISETMF